MRPTETAPLPGKIYPKLMGFLKFRWFILPILLGLITSWLIKGPITPLLLGGKSFDGRSLLYQILILVIYVFFTSAVYFCALIIVSLLSIKWVKPPFYQRASGVLIRFLRYIFLNSRTSDMEKGEAIPNIEQPISSGNLSVFTEEKAESFYMVGWLRSYWIYVMIYIFFLYVSSTTARAGDDWEVSNWYANGFLSTLAGTIRLGIIFNARWSANLFASFFSHYDFLWRFAAPAFFTSIIYLSARMFGYVRKPALVSLSLLILLSVSDGIRLQTYVWLIGNVGYIPIIALILLYLNIIYNENTDQRLQFWQSEKLNGLFVFLLAFVIGLWVEHVAIAFAAANILLALLSYLKSGKIFPYIRYGIAGCALSSLILFSTPNSLATSRGLEVGIVPRIVQNVPGIMQLLVVDNLPIYFLFFVIFIASSVLGKIGSSSAITRIVSIALASSVALIILMRTVFQFLFEKWYLPVGNILNFINGTFFQVNKPFPVVFCFAILLFILIAVFLSPQKEKLLVLYCIGLVSAGVLIGAPYLGARLFVLAIAMLMSITVYMASTIVIKSIDLRKAALLSLTLLTLLRAEKFYYYGEYVKQAETIRLQLIDSYRARIANGLTPKDEFLVLPVYKADAVYAAANPGFGGFYMGPFKRYYHLPPDANVIFDDGFGVKAFTATQVNDLFYRFEVMPLHDVSEYAYEFVVRENGGIIYKSAVTTDNFDYYEFPGQGVYTVSCVLSQVAGQREIYATEPVEINGE